MKITHSSYTVSKNRGWGGFLPLHDAAPRTRTYAHAVLILGLVINSRIVFSLSFFLSFLRFLFWPCLAPFCVVSTRLRHSPQTKSGYKKSASFPTRQWLVVVFRCSWIYRCFCFCKYPIQHSLAGDIRIVQKLNITIWFPIFWYNYQQ